MFKKIFLPVCGLLLLMACRKNQQDTGFYGDAKVFFAPNDASDSLVHSFANNAAAEYKELMLSLKIMGEVADKERMAEVEVVAGETTALPAEYELGKAVVPAGSVLGYLPLKLVNSARLDTRSVQLTLRLKPSAAFTVEKENPALVNELVKFKVIWTDVLEKPADWPETIWGGYSKKKHRLVIDLTGYFIYSGSDWTASGRAYEVLGLCNEWLDAYNAAHPGAPYVDENNNTIRFCITCN